MAQGALGGNIYDDGPESQSWHIRSASGDCVKDYAARLRYLPLRITQEQIEELFFLIEFGARAMETLEKGQAGKSREEFFHLRRQYVRGRRAKEQLIEAHLNMVVDQARRLVARGLELADLVQEGNRGLMKAVEKYDGSYANGFRAYAQLYIHQRMSRAIANKARAIRVPVNVLADREKLDASWDRYWDEHQQTPTLEEWSAYSRIAKNRIFLAYSIPDEPVSLNTQVGEDEEELGQIIDLTYELDMDNDILASELPRALGRVLGTMHPREAGVISARFGLIDGKQKTLEQIGEMYGVTRERVRQIEAKAMSILRYPARSIEVSHFRALR
mgnify:CR=1 FL=1